MSEQRQTYAEKYASNAYSQARENNPRRKPVKASGKYSRQKKSKYTEFSKWLLIQETALIWLVTITFLALAFICIKNQYFSISLFPEIAEQRIRIYLTTNYLSATDKLGIEH